MKKYRKIIIIILIVFISIGFAYISSLLNINGSVSFKDNKFDVHFENIKVISEDVSYSNLEIDSTDPTTINSSINFKEPSEIFEYTVDVVNGGGIDALFSNIETNLDSTNEEYISFDIKYYDGSTINENDLLRMGQSKKIRVKVIYNYDIDNLPTISTTNIVLTMNYINVNIGDINYDRNVWTYDYTGYEQVFVVPRDGTYKIEAWGAQGGYSHSSYGGYISGNIRLTKNEKIYVYVGQQKLAENSTSFNGGTSTANGRPGGGATDVRLISGKWNDDTSLNSRIMVAGGGGTTAGSAVNNSGYAGGLRSGTSYIEGYEDLRSTPSTQTSSGTSSHICSNDLPYGFGVGGACAGGGGGYYGGVGTAGVLNYAGGSGGSSFISGHNGCVAITSESDRTPRLDSSNNPCADGTTDITCSYHYSGYKFTDTVMIDGAGFNWTTERGSEVVGMPTHDGTGTMIGNTGNGFAKITFIE